MCNIVKVMLGNVALMSGGNLLLIHCMSWGKAENKWCRLTGVSLIDGLF